MVALWNRHHHTTTILRPFFRDHPGEPVPEDCFWSLWCKARLTEADTPTVRLGATPSGLTNADLHHPPFFTGWMPFLRSTNSVEALKADHYIFILWFLFSSFFSSPYLSGRRLDVCHTSTHFVALVRISRMHIPVRMRGSKVTDP